MKNGEAPVCMRITVNKRVAEIMVKRSVPIPLWNQAKECSKGKDHTAKELNHYLETIKARIYQIQREMEIDGVTVTADAIRDCYYRKNDNSRTICELYKEHNEKCRSLIGIDYTASTVSKFDTSFSHIREFIKHHYKKEDVLLTNIDPKFVTDFEFYLKTVKRCQQNSSIKHLKILKKIIRTALSNDWIKKDPFANIRFKHEETNVEFLTQEELTRIINKEFSIERLSLVRDIFVFCCYTGLAFIDVQQLSKEHIIKDNNGSLWIRKNRQKTGNTCNIPLLSPAIHILEKYSDNPYCIEKGVLLPVMSNQKLNSYLKEIADLCGVAKNLTTHCARYTFASTIALANNVSLPNVAKMLGHSDTRMTQHYAKVMDSSILRDMENGYPTFYRTKSYAAWLIFLFLILYCWLNSGIVK